MSGIPAETLLLCLVCGVLLGFVFAVLEFLRLLFSLGKIAAAVTDVLFCLFAAVVTFLLSLAVSVGHARFFQIACEVIGFLCVQVTVTHGICRFLPYAERRQKQPAQHAERGQLARAAPPERKALPVPHEQRRHIRDGKREQREQQKLQNIWIW